jgi:hypothetical protein
VTGRTARRAPEVGLGDIVRYDGHSWDEVAVEPPTTDRRGKSQVMVGLQRFEQSPGGRGRHKKIRERVERRQLELLAKQGVLPLDVFGEDGGAPASHRRHYD